MKQKRTKYIKTYLTEKEIAAVKEHTRVSGYSSDAEFLRLAVKEKVRKDKKKAGSV